MNEMYCIPSAGSSSHLYKGWNKQLFDITTVIPVELSGRGNSYKSENCLSIAEEANRILNFIIPRIENPNYYLFGHSMGALIALELTYKLQARKWKLPSRLILSGVNPPMINKKVISSILSDDLLIEKVRNMGGIATELLENYEYMTEIFLPMFRNDLKKIELYKFSHHNEQIECPLIVFNGLQDKQVNLKKLFYWRHIRKDFSHKEFDGGHFYFNDPFFSYLSKLMEEDSYDRVK